MPNGGIRIVEKSCESYGYKVDENIEYIYHNLRRTHNDGVKIIGSCYKVLFIRIFCW